MDEGKNKFLTDENIRAINEAIAKNQRVEIVQTGNGLKLYTVKRKELNT